MYILPETSFVIIETHRRPEFAERDSLELGIHTAQIQMTLQWLSLLMWVHFDCTILQASQWPWNRGLLQVEVLGQGAGPYDCK